MKISSVPNVGWKDITRNNVQLFMIILLLKNQTHLAIQECHGVVFQTRGHKPEECLYLYKIVSNPSSIYCKFWRYVGHDEKDCRAYQLLKDRIVDTYLMKGDEHIQYDREMCSLIILGVIYVGVRGGFGWGRVQIIFYKCVQPWH